MGAIKVPTTQDGSMAVLGPGKGQSRGLEPPCLLPRATLSKYILRGLQDTSVIRGREEGDPAGKQRPSLHWNRPLSKQAFPPAGK